MAVMVTIAIMDIQVIVVTAYAALESLVDL